MSEVISRPSAPRGRGSARGGRGGYSSRGGRGGARSTKADIAETTAAPTTLEDEGEIGQLKLKYATELPTLKELFHDWTDEDLVFALEDANGVLESAIEHISEGNASQWGEVKKKTIDRSRTKVKDLPKAQTSGGETVSATTRGGRGRGGFEGRGGRARGDRGRGGRGGRAGAVRDEKPAPTAEQVDTSIPTETPVTADTTAPIKPAETTETVKEQQKEAPKLPEPAKKGWASLFAKPTPPPPQKKPPPSTVTPAAPPVETPLEPKPATIATPVPVPAETTEVPKPDVPEQPPVPLNEPTPEIPSTQSFEQAKDDLTKTNLDQVPDVSVPPATATAASTVASVQDPNSLPPVTPQSRGLASGYAATAFKAAGNQGRAPSFQRRVLEQQEAVVMPANHAVDRAAVQFGSMGLNGNDSVDIDEQREEAETRAQPPQHSPVAPRASLPPPVQPHAPAETPSIARPAPGLPPVPQAASTDAAAFNDFGRYGEAQKPYDPFAHHPSQTQAQEPFSHQAPTQAAVTTGSEYSPFYAADQQRLPYNYYGYPSQDSTGQRGAAGFAVSGAEGQPQAPATQTPSRYGHAEAPGSGQNTPNPTLPITTQTQQPSAQHIPGAQGAHAGYGYGYPYYSNPHYAQSYMNMNQQHQYGRNRPMYDDARRYEDHYMPHSNQYGYTNQYAPYGKGGVYGQPFSYDHSSSPANAGGFNQALPGRDSVYGRAGSAQPENQQSATGANTTFGSAVPDVFGRSQSGFGQNQPISQQQPVSSEETTKGFEASKTGGPSPSLAQANRPGSATNSIPGQSQSQTGLPPLQGQQGQQGFGGYPHLNPQYGGGLGGLGSHQAGGVSQNHHQASTYGNYGAAGFGNYYGNSGRGGWGGNYGH